MASMTTKLLLCGTLLFTFLAAGLASGQPNQAPPPPPRKIPGITTEDPYPHGCVDCHLNYAAVNLDTRFRTLLNGWHDKVEPALLAKAQASAPKEIILRGKHPNASSALVNIPAQCLTCHNKTSKTAPPFAPLIHSIHFTGGEKNHFLTLFQGECTYCHKLDLATGHWTIPSAPER